MEKKKEKDGESVVVVVNDKKKNGKRGENGIVTSVKVVKNGKRESRSKKNGRRKSRKKDIQRELLKFIAFLLLMYLLFQLAGAASDSVIQHFLSKT
ncbi:MAG: hypothetical protein ACK4SY_07790 [Pyrobaculum sp.]